METLLFFLQSMVLGVVEGVTEFLPISSTGHLIVFEDLLGFQGSAQYVNTYSYVIQLGAILAVVLLYRQKILATLQAFLPRGGAGRPFRESGLGFWCMLALACLPGLACVLLVGDWVDAHFFCTRSVAVVLVLGGVGMLAAEGAWGRARTGAPAGPWIALTPKQALCIGAFQCLSVVPGMSRSAATILGGWAAGLGTPASTEISFFLAIPVMVGMSGLKLLQIGGFGGMTATELVGLAIGFAVSFLVALVVVRKFVAFLQRRGLAAFGIYRILFGGLTLLLVSLGAVSG